MRWFAAVLGVVLVAGVVAMPSEVGAHTDHGPVLPPVSFTESECAGATPVVVGSDAAAQSDIYSAVTLAGVVGTECVILAGPRNRAMPADQRSRLDAAASGGYVVGGVGAVPDAKIAGRNMTRIAGVDRWSTAQQVGSQARMLGGGTAPDAPALDASLMAPGDVQQPGVHLSGAGPWIASDCAGGVPIVVGSDARAQSDIYSAVTLAGVIGTDCVILAGPRDGTVPASQQARLAAAASGGFVVGGIGAVPTAKLAGRDMTRLSGADRWATAQLVGRRATGDTTAGTSTAAEPDEVEDAEAGDLTSEADYVAQPTDGVNNRWPLRGDLVVNVSLCVARGLEHHFDQADLVEYTEHYNRAIAPFYSWQSSGVLDVRFAPGQLLVSTVASEAETRVDWGHPLGPVDCLDRLSDRGKQRLIHSMIVYSHLGHSEPGGLAYIGGDASTFVHHVDGVKPGVAILGDEKTFTTQHELDHAIGLPHYYGCENGYVRVKVSSFEQQSHFRAGRPPTCSNELRVVHRDDSVVLGTFGDYPTEIGFSERRRLGGQRGRVPSVYPCYVLRANGWPRGEEHPACVLMPPSPPPVSIVIEADGSVRITWPPGSIRTAFNSTFELEPATGYRIRVFQGSPQGTAITVADDAIKIVDEHVSARTTSLDLPAGTIDSTDYGAEIGVLVTPTSVGGVGIDGSKLFKIFPFVTQITAKQRPSRGVDPPIVFDLSWPPAPRVSVYMICVYHATRSCEIFDTRNQLTSTDSDHAPRLTETSFVLSDVDGRIAEGESYGVTVFACDQAYEPVLAFVYRRLNAPPGCSIYATTKITAAPPQQLELSTLEFGPPLIMGDCSFTHRVTGTSYPCHRVTWPRDPGTDVYLITVGCGAEGTDVCQHPTTLAPTDITDRPPSLPDGHLGSYGITSLGRGWAYLNLPPGVRHLIRVYACSASDDLFQRCLVGPDGDTHGTDAWLVGESWVTVPESGS